MRGILALLCVLPLGWPASSGAQQKETFDYWQGNRTMIRDGQQAIFMCNGLFTSNRTLEQVFEQELAFLPQPVGTARGGDYVVDRERRAVAIGGGDGSPTMRAAFRPGIGCIIMGTTRPLTISRACRRSTCCLWWVTRIQSRGRTEI